MPEDSAPRFTRREAERLLSAAAESDPEAADDGLTMEELSRIAAEAEIDPGQLETAMQRLRARRRHLGLIALAAAAAGVTAALLLVPLARRAPASGRLVQIHNEHPRSGFVVELLVPRPGARDRKRCVHPPTARVAGSEYCRLARAFLAPGARYAVNAPAAPRSCPQVWVRASGDDGSSTSALFSMPASIEIERSGRLDRKGLGRPGMYGTPELPDRLEPCPSATGAPP
jgi:hypothetical protein